MIDIEGRNFPGKFMILFSKRESEKDVFVISEKFEKGLFRVDGYAYVVVDHGEHKE